ncbi:MAG: NAD(P)-dependent oxidoreductase [Chloroflexota bacterium]
MSVVVTGGSGHTGTAIVSQLVAQGYDVISIDRSPSPLGQINYKLVDCEDLGALFSVCADAQAIVHLAAIPRPIYHAPAEVYRVNTMTAFNVFEVAATLEIPRVVYISSVSVLGFPFSYSELAPEFVPIDETHPQRPEDAYALSKYMGEAIAAACVRRTQGKVSVVSLRPPWIHTPETFKAELLPHQGNAAFGATNLWSYVDSRDVAQATQLALEADIEGHEPFFISAANSFMNQPTAPLIEEFYPGATIREGFTGNQSLLDWSKAHQMLGYRPAYSWEMYLEP